MTEHLGDRIEREDNDSKVSELLQKLDDDTKYMSGGFEKTPDYAQLVELGESALPCLLTFGDGLDWCRMQAVFSIADALGKPIEVPKEIAGHYHEVSELVTSWATEHGYIERPE